MLSRSNSPRSVSTTPCPSAPVFPFQHDDGFYVVGVGEHVHRPDGAHLVAALHQLAHVAGLGCGVARDVDDALGGKRRGAREELGRGTGPRRIHEQDEGLRTLLRCCKLLHESGGVLRHELGVFHTVVAGVVGGVADGRLHGIDADNAAAPRLAATSPMVPVPQ